MDRQAPNSRGALSDWSPGRLPGGPAPGPHSRLWAAGSVLRTRPAQSAPPPEAGRQECPVRLPSHLGPAHGGGRLHSEWGWLGTMMIIRFSERSRVDLAPSAHFFFLIRAQMVSPPAEIIRPHAIVQIFLTELFCPQITRFLLLFFLKKKAAIYIFFKRKKEKGDRERRCLLLHSRTVIRPLRSPQTLVSLPL